jgi:oligopeptide transport system substrate-binding protein
MIITPPRLLVVLAGAGLALVLWWLWSTAWTARPAPAQTVGFVTTGRISSLNPQEAAAPGTNLMRTRLLKALWEGLVELDPRTQRPKPALAASWEFSSEDRTATFHLRPDARWSNGEPLIAADYVYSVRVALSTNAAASEAMLLLKNARRYREQLTNFSTVGIEALDEHTLRLHLEHPVPGLLNELCDVAWLPVHAGSYEVLRRQVYWHEPATLVSNGAFRLKDATTDQLVLEANPWYPARGEVGPDRLVLQYTEDESLYPCFLQAGTAQITDRLPTGVGEMPKWPDIEVVRDVTLVGGFVHFNLRRGPLADVRVRRALSLALDRVALVRQVSALNIRPARACLPPIADWAEMQTVEENLAEAQRQLAEAGYPDGRGFPVLRWPYGSSGVNATVQVPDACAAQWRERLHIPLYLVPREAGEFHEVVQRRDYDVVYAPMLGAMPDLARLASQLSEPAMRAYSGWDGGRVTALAEVARQETGEQLRTQVLAVEREYLAEMPATPLIFYNRTTLKDRRVVGWYPDPIGLHPLKYLHFAEASP